MAFMIFCPVSNSWNHPLPIWLLSCDKGADLVEFNPLRIIGEGFWSTSPEAIEVIIRGWGETDLCSFMTGLLPVMYFWEADLWWWLFCLKPVMSINIKLKISYGRKSLFKFTELNFSLQFILYETRAIFHQSNQNLVYIVVE